MARGDVRSDAQLIDACNRGDDRAFEVLYRRHRDAVLRIALRFTADREVALDAMQEAFMHLLGRIPGFRLQGRLTTYLYPVVKHAVYAAGRKRRGLTYTPAPPDREGREDPTAIDELDAVLAHLSEEHREVVLLRYADGLTLEEIAHALQLPAGTVKSRLHHAVQKLRDDPRVQAYFEV